jgi:predicted RNA-binding protein with PUA-like domain
MPNYWLMKSEPDVFSIEDLERRPKQTEPWNGVRNYQARNFMRDDMRVGDGVLFYHSNCASPGVAGLAEVSREAYPDDSAWDASSPYFDPKSKPEQPRWFMVDVRWKETFPAVVTLPDLREEPSLAQLRVLQRGNRLSITPVTAAEYKTIIRLAKRLARHA